MTKSEPALRDDIIETALAMNAAGINRGKAGNVSARWRDDDGFDGFLITPSGLPYARTTPGDIVAMTLGGESRGTRTPSSEWRFHRDIYRARGRRNRPHARTVRDDARLPRPRHSRVSLHGRRCRRR